MLDIYNIQVYKSKKPLFTSAFLKRMIFAYADFLVRTALVFIMATSATKTLNIRIPKEQYDEIEEIVRARHYTSKGEYIRQLLRESIDEYAAVLHDKAQIEKDKYVPLNKYDKKGASKTMTLEELNRCMEKDRVSDADSTRLIREMRNRRYK